MLDVAGGGDVARKGGPGIGRADLLVVNKTDLGPYVGVDVPLMVADAAAARDGRPVLGLSRLDAGSIAALKSWLRGVLREFRAGRHVPVDPGPMAPHWHADQNETDGGYVHAHDLDTRDLDTHNLHTHNLHTHDVRAHDGHTRDVTTDDLDTDERPGHLQHADQLHRPDLPTDKPGLPTR